MAGRPERVGIVVPFYRAGKYLAEALDSISCQRHGPDWHLYLVNDGSDDDDVSIARSFCRQSPDKATFLEHEGRSRRGVSASRNLAIRHSSENLIAFLDADDVWTPDKLAFQIEALNQRPGADMIYGPAVRWHSWNGGVDFDVPATVDGYGTDCLVPGSALLSTFLRDESLTPCIGSVLIRKSALQRAGYFEEQFPGLYDDQVLYAKLSLWARIYVSSHCVSRYRKHPESCCSLSEKNDIHADERNRFLTWLEGYLRMHQGETTPSAIPPRE